MQIKHLLSGAIKIKGTLFKVMHERNKNQFYFSGILKQKSRFA
jgi:hypothetical protein